MRGNDSRVFGNIRLAAAALLAVCAFGFLFPALTAARQRDENIVSKHVRLLIPVERQWLGREVINDLERCWEFIQGATGGRLPGRVMVVIEWEDGSAAVDTDRSIVTIGMNNPAAAADMKGYLIHGAVREMARLALIALTKGRAEEDGNRFLLNGMAEMLAHEYSSSVRRLGASWAISYYLDRMTPLTLKQMPGRQEFSAEARDLRSAAPGITFLTACREAYGRERVMKLFESLAKKNLEESLTAVFRVPTADIEAAWLKRVRAYKAADVTVAGEDEAPVLDRVTLVPLTGMAAATQAVRIFTHDGAKDLLPQGIFLIDDASGKVLQGNLVRSGNTPYVQVEIPIDAAGQAGSRTIQVVAIDEGGNVRNWSHGAGR